MVWDWVRQYAALLAPLFVLQIILMIAALRDLIPRRPEEVVTGSKALWYVVVIVMATIGPIIYLAIGRRKDA